MGCAGSKPLVLTSDGPQTNTPRKGCIIFNDKMIEHLKANEKEINDKIVEILKQKLTGVNSKAETKSLFGTTRKHLAFTGKAANGHANEAPASNGDCPAEEKPKEGVDETKEPEKVDNNVEASTETTEKNNFKDNAIEAVVKFVLKYTTNDFDANKFKSGNQISLKQIRKDILKKNQQERMQQSKTDEGVDIIINYSTLKHNETTFYKLALNTAIDEFCRYTQENLSGAESTKESPAEAATTTTDTCEENKDKKEESTVSETKPEVTISVAEPTSTALKLKEALELARQNFYQGKPSMVCLDSKTDGYVVKEIKDAATEPNAAKSETTAYESPKKQNEKESEKSSPITPENLSSAKTVTILDPQTNQKSKVAISSKINIDGVDISDTFKIIDTKQNRSGVEDETASLLNASDVSETTKQLCANQKTNNWPAADLVKLIKSVMENMTQYFAADEKDETIKLEKVSSLKEQLETFKTFTNNEATVEANDAMKSTNDELQKMIAEFMPKKPEVDADSAEIWTILEQYESARLSLSKALAPIGNVNCDEVAVQIKEAIEDKNEEGNKEVSLTVTAAADETTANETPSKKSKKKNAKKPKKKNSFSFDKISDFKRDIATRITNVGHALAKTIDSLSLDHHKDVKKPAEEPIKEVDKVDEVVVEEKESAVAVVVEEASKEIKPVETEVPAEKSDEKTDEEIVEKEEKSVNEAVEEKKPPVEEQVSEDGDKTPTPAEAKLEETTATVVAAVEQIEAVIEEEVTVAVSELKINTEQEQVAKESAKATQENGQGQQQQTASSSASSLSSPSLSTASSLSTAVNTATEAQLVVSSNGVEVEREKRVVIEDSCDITLTATSIEKQHIQLELEQTK